MKKTLWLLVILGIALFQGTAAEKNELKTSVAILSIDQKGNLMIMLGKGEVIRVNSPVAGLWRMVLKNKATGREYEIAGHNDYRISREGEVIRIDVDGLPVENRILPVKAGFTVSVREDAFCFSGTVKGIPEEWMIKELVYPDISGIKILDHNLNIFWPEILGQRFDSPEAFGSRSVEYPSNHGTMAWFSVNSPATGIYVGSHDPLQGPKKFSLDYLDHDKSFKTRITFPVYAGEFSIPDVMVKPYRGKWYAASGFYRNWYLKNFKLAGVSQWARNCEGYMLTILKQQNGEVMYRYNEVDKLCDIAGKLNFKLVGLWGRGVGGHDRYYPNYMPDNLLGGREEMKKAIRNAHERGFKVIVYTNGKIMDTSTDFYKYNGIETMMLDEKGQPKLEFWLKHQHAAPVIFAVACHGSALWRKTIMDLALEAQSLGADAFYIDQISQVSAMSNICFSKFHDHALPQEGWSKYRLKMVRDIREKMREIDPEFTIMTEGINDSMLPYVDMFQGIPYRVDDPLLFPEMFRYTFPESIAITLNADPGLTRWDANYSTCYGLRHQIMSRYPADAAYLYDGKIPVKESYSNVTGPPDVEKFTRFPARDITAYTHDLFKFENDNAGFFRSGRFIDEDGIEVTGEDILGKGFMNGNKLGVVVWNKHLTEKREFSVSVPGYRCIKASEPGKPEVQASGLLDANTLRLMVFEKN